MRDAFDLATCRVRAELRAQQDSAGCTFEAGTCVGVPPDERSTCSPLKEVLISSWPEMVTRVRVFLHASNPKLTCVCHNVLMHIYIYIYIYIYMHRHRHKHIFFYICINTTKLTYMHACMHACIHVCTYMYVDICPPTFIAVHVYV